MKRTGAVFLFMPLEQGDGFWITAGFFLFFFPVASFLVCLSSRDDSYTGTQSLIFWLWSVHLSVYLSEKLVNVIGQE